MLHVHVRYKVKPGMRKAFVEAITKAKTAAKTMAEPGNLGYEFFVPLANDDDLFLLECWENEAALDPHREMEHYKELQAFKAEYVLNTDIRKIRESE